MSALRQVSWRDVPAYAQILDIQGCTVTVIPMPQPNVWFVWAPHYVSFVEVDPDLPAYVVEPDERDALANLALHFQLSTITDQW